MFLKNLKEQFNKKTSIADTIPIIDFDDTGIFEVRKGFFSKSYRLKDINYRISKEEDQADVILKWCKILNSIDPAVSFQFTTNVRNTDEEAFTEMITLEDQGDYLDPLRRQYNRIVLDKMHEGNNTLVRDKYITFGLEAENIAEASTRFTRLMKVFMQSISQIKGADITPIGTPERLKIIHDIFNMGDEADFREQTSINHRQTDIYSVSNIYAQGAEIKEIVAPNFFKANSRHLVINEKKVKVYYLSPNLPTLLSDTLLSDICAINANIILTLNVRAIANDKGLKIARHRVNDISADVIEAQKKASKSGYSGELISPRLKLEAEEANELFDDLQKRDQRLFETNLIMTIFGDDDAQIDDIWSSVVAVCSKRGVQFLLMDGMIEEGFASCLPLGCNFVPKIRRTLTTESLAIMTPFSSQELVQKNGLYYGLNSVSNNMILYDRFSGDNYNGFIFGTPGSGKSFAAKMEMINILIGKGDADVIVIDPESEYSPLASMLGGQIIDVKAGSKYHINPFDIDIAYATEEGDPVVAKVEFIQSMMEIIAGNGSSLSPSVSAMIDRAARNVYKDWSAAASQGASPEELDELVPTLLDYWNEISDIAEEEAMPELMEVSKALELYVTGTLNVFSFSTNVQTNSRFIVYDIKELGAKILPLGMLIMLDSIWNRICRNRKLQKPTFVYIDEIYLLFKNTMAATFLQSTWKRARKYLGAPCGITQNVGDLLQSDIARTMISNSSYITMLNQASLDLQVLAQLLNLSDTQCEFVTNASSGNGLIYISASQGKKGAKGLTGGAIPFYNNFPHDNDLYRAMSTKLKE